MALTYQIITSTTLASSQATITFSNIPQTYTDLVLRVSARGSSAFANISIFLLPNGDTSGQSNITFRASGTTVATTTNNQVARWIGYGMGANGSTNNFSDTEVYIGDYTTASQKQMCAANIAPDQTQGQWISVASKLNTLGALTSMQIKTDTSTDFVSGSTFYLYGIKRN